MAYVLAQGIPENWVNVRGPSFENGKDLGARKQSFTQ